MNLNPILTYPIDICCLAFLAYFKWYKTLWSVQTKYDNMRNIVFAVLVTISILVFAVTMWVKETAFPADLLRPFIIINFLRNAAAVEVHYAYQ